MKKIVQKSKKASRLIFGRTAVVILSLIVQAVTLVAAVFWLSEYSTLIYIAFVLLGAVTVIHILNEESNASFKMAWMIPVLVIPVFGTLVYLYVNMQLGTKLMNSRLGKMEEQTAQYVKQSENTLAALDDSSAGEKGLAQYLYNVGRFPVYRDNELEFFPLGEDKFEEMLRQLRRARKFIFMEYFIVTESEMWNTVLAVLREKVAEGVEVRFMYDGMCSLMLLPYGYYKELETMGIQSRPFSQIKPVLSTYQNNRDHRKILIIDGETAFTGGINLADEYINRIVRFGHWKDTAVMIKGEAVKSFTYMFLKMWHVAGRRDQIPETDLKNYIFDIPADRVLSEPDLKNTRLHGGGYVIPYCDSPFDSEQVGKRVYIDILNRAKKYVHIMTPYLILDDETIAALRYCAARGVETVVIMPHIPDKVYAYLLARTYYKELLQHGVHIYEYTPGFVHAKEFISDDVRATVGTINLDFRSLYLHFECGAYIYENPVVAEIEADFAATLRRCEKITEESCRQYSKFKLLIGKVLRLFAPLM